MENSISSDLIRGHIDTIILRTLTDSDKHALDISKCIEEKSDNRYELKQATLYSSLKRLENLSYIKAYWGECEGGRRRYFHLTEKGKNFVDQNLKDWQFSRSVIDKLITNNGNLPDLDLSDSVSTRQNAILQSPAKTQSSETQFVVNNNLEQTNVRDNYQHVQQEKQSENKPVTFSSMFLQAQQEKAAENNSTYQSADKVNPDAKTIDEPKVIYRPYVFNEPQKSFAEQQSIIDKKLEELAAENARLRAEKSQLNTESSTAKTNDEAKQDVKPNEEASVEQKQYTIVSDAKDENRIEQENNYKQILGNLVKKNEVSATTFTKTEEIIEEKEPETAVIIEKQPVIEEEIYIPKTTSGRYDYSDIFDKAEYEGYKIKISQPSIKVKKNGILVNKLNMATALTAFLCMMLEMVLFTFIYNNRLSLNAWFYIIPIILFAIYPAVTVYKFFKEPLKKSTKKFPAKNMMINSILIAFNLMLIILAIVFLTETDLSILRNVVFLFLAPIGLFMNVALYFLINFLLLKTNLFNEKQ